MISDGTGAALPGPDAARPTAGWAPEGRRAWWWALGAAGLVLALVYAPNLLDLGRTWRDDDNYQHGFLVIPIAVFLLWRRLADLPWEPGTGAGVGSSPWWGWGLLAASLAARAFAYERSYNWVETATLLPAVIGLIWSFGGLPLLRRAWPAVAFLVFMLPLPNAVNGTITLPLQRIAATGSFRVLQLCGFWVVQRGNVLGLETPFGPRPLDVALACSGLKMLMTLAATVTATILLLPLPSWKRIVLLLSAVPIALASNIARIVTTAWCYYYLEGESGQHWAHDISGWMMMPLALLLVGLELQILTWLVPPQTEAEVEEGKAYIPLISGKAKGGKPPGIAE